MQCDEYILTGERVQTKRYLSIWPNEMGNVDKELWGRASAYFQNNEC